MAIYFYSTTDTFGAFSNFAPRGVKMDGEWWPTVEHYFQGQKFLDATYRDRIRGAHSPKQAKALGSSRKIPLRNDWEEVKEEIMYRACLKKFQTHREIRELLFATGDEELVENAPGDYYWGCGANGSGENKLGLILMRVRQELMAQEQDALSRGQN